MEHEQTIPEQRKEGESAPESDTSVPRRRVGRTALLIAGAAALGVLAGTVTGYAVQYHREPTPLPPLAQQKMAVPQPQAMNGATTKRSINANRWHQADEELAKKLVEVPGGTQDSFSGPVSPDAFSADYFAEPAGGLGGLGRKIKRIATARWAEGDSDVVEIHLLQFRDRTGVENFYSGVLDYMPDAEHAGNAGKEFPGAPADFGHMWISELRQKPGYHPMRLGRVLVRRGDTVMSVKWTNHRGDVDEKALVELAKRQMERL
ncbi:hypothetical protein [Streptomyces sp. SID1046]|uniref:hypothetical protein n=1 Tax=Streptomyces sp. SID1046 TaxID=2690249 RepID=UPI001F3390B6|nr:hypothetical protein [Streptomyces sp. SID1046]